MHEELTPATAAGPAVNSMDQEQLNTSTADDNGRKRPRFSDPAGMTTHHATALPPLSTSVDDDMTGLSVSRTVFRVSTLPAKSRIFPMLFQLSGKISLVVGSSRN